MAPEHSQDLTLKPREEGEPSRLSQAAGLLYEWIRLDMFPTLMRRMGLDLDADEESKDDLEPLPPVTIARQEGSSLTSKLAFVMALASLGTAVYFHVPLVQDAVLELWRGAGGAQAEDKHRASPRSDGYDYTDPEDEEFDPDEPEDAPETRNARGSGSYYRNDTDTESRSTPAWRISVFLPTPKTGAGTPWLWRASHSGSRPGPTPG